MMTFNDFIRKQILRDKTTSNMKIQHVLSSLSLDDVAIYLRDGQFPTEIGIVNLHPSKGTHWAFYLNEKKFDKYGCSPPKKLSKLITKRNGYCLYSEYQLQKRIVLVQVIVYI